MTHPTQYLVSVCGANAPSKLHGTLPDAKAEAERLSLDPRNRDRQIYVVALVAVLKPSTTHVWSEA